jgi:hypothetical protein
MAATVELSREVFEDGLDKLLRIDEEIKPSDSIALLTKAEICTLAANLGVSGALRSMAS